MSEEVTALREFGLAVLRRRYGTINLMRGQGIQAGTRVEFQDSGEKIACAVKAATGASARIYFPYRDGEWRTLSQVDRVLCVRNLPGANGEFEARMYQRKTLVDAFNENRRAAEAGGFTNLPAWLSADKENEPRFAGSGFARFALWSERSGVGEAAKQGDDTAPVRPFHNRFALAVDRAKRQLAAELNLPTSSIEIVIRA